MAQRDIAFPTLSDSQIAMLEQFATPRHFADGEWLFQAGLTRVTFFVVRSGTVEIIDRTGDQPRTVAVHHPGEFTGDIDILSSRRSVVSAVARGDTDVLEVAPADIGRLISEDQTMGELILHAFIARREQLIESGFQGVRIIGSGTSRDSYRIREFLGRNQVPVTWIDVDDNPSAKEMLRNFGVDDSALPVVMCEAQPLLRNPSTRELALAVGLKRTIGEEVYDLVIVGAGPAGLAAAVYGASEGLTTLMLDAESPGGQAGSSNSIENYLGFPMGITGADLTRRATLQAQKFGASISTPSPAIALGDAGSHLIVKLEDGESAFARCVLIATGADYRKLDVPERERFEGLGVYYVATPTELDACSGAEVVIVGAGNSAGQAALFLAQHTRRVLILVRRDDMRRTMSSYLADRIEASHNIDVLYTTQIRAMAGAARLERVDIENTTTGEKRTIATPAVFTFIGAVPRTDWLPPQIDTDPKGFICTGRALANTPGWTRKRQPFLLETSQPGVFAAGDVRLGSAKRVAAAVGEGSMVVKFVHEYLAELREDVPLDVEPDVQLTSRVATGKKTRPVTSS
ncbi:MAG: FAD-dependent oxidoreductase [Gemmatimonadales bacterium]